MLFSILITTAHLTLANHASAAPVVDPLAASEVADLKRRLKQVTAEADALWKYVGSGPENPDLKALERASALLSLRRRAGK